MKVSIGQGYTIPLADNHRCDITLYEGKVFNELNYDIWHNDYFIARYHNSTKFFRWELLFGKGKSISSKLTNRKLLKVIHELNDKIKLLGIDDEISIKTKTLI